MIYDDDRFHPTNFNDIDNKQDTTSISYPDNGYNKVIKTYMDDNGVKHKYILEYYSSGSNQSLIRNAVTGVKYKNLRVGTRDEDILFKISINTFENNKNKEVLFYDSPEQYEAHQYCKLSPNTINKWYEKRGLHKS
jgi:hypothetical protein